MIYKKFNSKKMYDEFIMNRHVVECRLGGKTDDYTILTYDDGTEWVFLDEKEVERFCGYLYLRYTIKKLRLNIVAAENKISIYNGKIIYLSKYMGEQTLSIFSNEWHKYNEDMLRLEKEIGFRDLSGYYNMRIVDDMLYVFDTEKLSYHMNVHQKIDGYKELHDSIRNYLEKII